MRNLYSLLLLLLIANTSYSQFVFNKIEINPGPNSSNPFSFDTLNGKMIFIAATDTAGYELYTSDGTQAGTTLLKNINPGSSGFYNGTQYAILDNSKYFFYANNGLNGLELWLTDGSTTGTKMVKDIEPFFSGVNTLYSIGTYKGAAYFAANRGSGDYFLWKSDGTDTGTKKFMEIQSPTSFINYNGKLYFIASDFFHKNREIWVTDSSKTGTVMVADINPGDGNAFALNTRFTILNGKMYFFANDGIHGYELWVSDGTTVGTTLVKDILPGPTSGGYFFTETIVQNNKLYFPANDSVHGVELWESDGTASGTTLVKDIYPGYRSSNIYNMKSRNGKLYFSAMDTFNHGEETWTSDGTGANTLMLKEIAPDTLSGGGAGFTAYKNHVFFQASDSTGSMYQSRLWVTDGTGTNTRIIAPPSSIDSPLVGIGLSNIVYKGSLYFPANFDGTGIELWSLRDTTGASIIASTTKNAISVYPNPNDGTFTLQLANTDYHHGSIIVYDVTGKIVYQQKEIPHTQIQQLKIDAPKGTYLLTLKLDDAIQTKLIVIK